MKKMSRTNWLVIINITTLLAAAGWATSLFWLSGPAPAVKQGQAPARTATPLPAARMATNDVEQFPIFNRLRKPIAEASAAAPAEPPPLSVPPVLLGIAGEAGHWRALLEDPSDSARKLVRRGDVFVGWTIVSISAKSAQLQAAGRDLTLSLTPPRPAPSGGATPEPAAQ